MKGVVQDDREARTLVEAALGVKICEPFSGLVFFDGVKVIGAAVFTHYTGRDVHYNATLFEGRVGMRIARQVAWYVFGVMGCHRCTAITATSNFRAIMALKKIGFVWEGVLREHFQNDEDGIVFGLLRSEQRLLRGL